MATWDYLDVPNEVFITNQEYDVYSIMGGLSFHRTRVSCKRLENYFIIINRFHGKFLIDRFSICYLTAYNIIRHMYMLIKVAPIWLSARGMLLGRRTTISIYINIYVFQVLSKPYTTRIYLRNKSSYSRLQYWF